MAARLSKSRPNDRYEPLSSVAAHAVLDVIPYPRGPNGSACTRRTRSDRGWPVAVIIGATLRYASGAVARVVAVVTAIAACYEPAHRTGTPRYRGVAPGPACR